MNNMNYLPNDLMSLILSIRTEEMRKDLDKKIDKQIEEWKEDSEDDYIRFTYEIHYWFTEEGPKFNHLELVEDAKLFSPYQVLQELREARQERINDTEIVEDFGNYYD